MKVNLQGLTSFRANTTTTEIETRLESYVATTFTLTDVDVTVSAPGGVHAGDKIVATVTGTHADAGEITVVAEIIIQA